MVIGVGDFFEFLFRPFTNPIGWVLLIGAVAYIYLRLSGKIGFKRDKPKGGSSAGADYEIKWTEKHTKN